jgi:hypothetical protein
MSYLCMVYLTTVFVHEENFGIANPDGGFNGNRTE